MSQEEATREYEEELHEDCEDCEIEEPDSSPCYACDKSCEKGIPCHKYEGYSP